MIATAMLSWAVAAVAIIIGGLLGLMIAQPPEGIHTRERPLTAGGCAFVLWWSVLSPIVVPVLSPWVLVGTGATGLVAAFVVLELFRARLRAALGAWPDVTQFCYQPPKWRATVIHQASDEQLCRAWRRSGEKLVGGTRSVPLLARYAALRQELLEALEARHPRAFAAWLSAPDRRDMRRYLSHRVQ